MIGIIHHLPEAGSSVDLSGVTATASDVLDGKVIVDANGNPLTGTMANISNLDLGPSIQLYGDYLYCRMHPGAHITNASSGYPEVYYPLSTVRSAIGYTNAAKVLNDTTICGMKGTMSSMSGTTITPKSSAQTVSCSGKYMTGNVVVNAADIFKMVSGSVTASTSKATFTKTGGYSFSLYYFTVNLSGFKQVKGMSWVSSCGGHAVSATSYNVLDARYGSSSSTNATGYYTSGATTWTNTKVVMPSGYSKGETVWYNIYGISS